MFSRRRTRLQTSLAPGFRGSIRPAGLPLATVLAAVALLAGCGQKGPLQRPSDAAAAAAAAASTPTRSNAPRSAP
ncbi:LPS translocon maturation chaperone LptM [Leptothrix sp. BB-4]